MEQVYAMDPDNVVLVVVIVGGGSALYRLSTMDESTT
jgi:glycerate-2-kinase